MLWRPVWDSLSPLLPEVLSGLTSNPWYFRALEIHLYKTWTKKGRKPGGHELPLVRQMTCSFINETITLEGGSKHIPSSLYNPQFSQAIPFNWAMTMEYLIVAWKFEEATSSESMFASGLLQSNISPACGKCCLIYATYGALWAVLLLFSKGLSLLIFLQTEMCSYLHLFKALPFVLHPGNSIFLFISSDLLISQTLKKCEVLFLSVVAGCLPAHEEWAQIYQGQCVSPFKLLCNLLN